MRARPGSNGGKRLRFIAATAAIGTIAGGIAGCGEDAAKSATSGASKGTFVNRSSPEEYCSVLEDLKASLSPGVEADDEAMLTAINTINDIKPLAPEESKADWSDMRMVMRAVVDADGADTVGTMSRAEVGSVYEELSGRVSDSVADVCGFSLS